MNSGSFKVDLELSELDGLLQLEFKSATGDELVLSLNEEAGKMSLDRSRTGETGFHEDFGRIHEAPMKMKGPAKLSILMDVSSIEVFVNGGEIVMTDIIFPIEVLNQLTFSAEGEVVISSGAVSELQPAEFDVTNTEIADF